MEYKKQFQMVTKSGDVYLVEIFEDEDTVTLILGEKRFDLNAESVFDLAEALYMAASNTINYHMEYEDEYRTK